jgi:hypothetical protein
MRVCHAYGYVIGLEPIRLASGLPANGRPLSYYPHYTASIALPDGVSFWGLMAAAALPDDPTPIDNSLARVYDVSTRNEGASHYKLTLRQLSALKNMSKSVRWNGQPLDIWASKRAQGKFVDLDGCTTQCNTATT